jgi:hypothetical protein
MPDLKRYWQEIRTIESNLHEPTWLVSQDELLPESHSRHVVEVSAAVAARFLHAKSHRLATPQEIEAQRAKEAVAKRMAVHDSLLKRGITVVALPSPEDGQ